MKIATCLIRDRPHYRHEAFIRGLERVGYRVTLAPPRRPDQDDVLVIWNRYSVCDLHARNFELHGARVVVAENAWVGHDSSGRHLFALCQRQHNGAGDWNIGSGDRWARLGIDLRDWRRDGESVVVLPQRGIGPPGVAMPRDWPNQVVARLKSITDRPIVVRKHPGNVNPKPDPDLKGAFAAVTWASGAGIKAIIAGIPVFHDLQAWIGAPAAKFGIDELESPFLGDRLPMLQRLAWAQWTVAEIESGEAFACLLSR